jgi:hypothetical protein
MTASDVLVIGPCTTRQLAQALALEGLPAETYSPESCCELDSANDGISELYAELEEHGLCFIKTEPVPLRRRVAGKKLVIVLPFYENKRLFRDRKTGCVVYLRFQPRSGYAEVFRRIFGQRFTPAEQDRRTYFERLSQGVSRLAESFPETEISVVLTELAGEWIRPDPVYHVPVVSDTFGAFRSMWTSGGQCLRRLASSHRNVRLFDADKCYERLLEAEPLRVQHVFPFFVPQPPGRAGYRRDVAHVSDLALRFLACSLLHGEQAPVPGRWLDDVRWDLYCLDSDEKRRRALQCGSMDLWANALENILLAAEPRRFTAEVFESLERFLRRLQEPRVLLVVFAFLAFARCGGLTLRPATWRGLMEYFLNQDLEYGAWKDFFRLATEHLAGLLPDAPEQRGSC